MIDYFVFKKAESLSRPNRVNSVVFGIFQCHSHSSKFILARNKNGVSFGFYNAFSLPVNSVVSLCVFLEALQMLRRRPHILTVHSHAQWNVCQMKGKNTFKGRFKIFV